MQYQLPFEREGKFILPKHFAYDNFFINVSDSESKAKDQVEYEFQSDPYPYPVPTPNPRPKWAQKVIEDARNRNIV